METGSESPSKQCRVCGKDLTTEKAMFMLTRKDFETRRVEPQGCFCSALCLGTFAWKDWAQSQMDLK